MSMAHAKRVGSAIVGLAVATSLVACESDDKDSDSGATSQRAGGGKGGTVTVYSINDVEHLDPARNFAADAGVIGKLITRTLTDYHYDTRSKKVVLEPDMAASWESSPDLKTWTFKLKDGIKYEDGTPITAADVKYGVERSFLQTWPRARRTARRT
jgi:peptide/nickel transport system substrate-binding protein